MDRLDRSRMAGTISVFADLETNPIRKAQLHDLIYTLQSNSILTKNQEYLLEEIHSVTMSCV